MGNMNSQLDVSDYTTNLEPLMPQIDKLADRYESIVREEQ